MGERKRGELSRKLLSLRTSGDKKCSTRKTAPQKSTQNTVLQTAVISVGEPWFSLSPEDFFANTRGVDALFGHDNADTERLIAAEFGAFVGVLLTRRTAAHTSPAPHSPHISSTTIQHPHRTMSRSNGNSMHVSLGPIASYNSSSVASTARLCAESGRLPKVCV